MSKRTRSEWDLFQLKLAKQYSTMSKDPSTKVGAVVCDKDSKFVYGLGYNGFSPEINDDYAYTLGRDYKMTHTIHAEMNALNQIYHEALDIATTLVVYPFLSCSHCVKSILKEPRRNDIKRVVTLDYVPERWSDDFKKSRRILEDAGIEVVTYPYKTIGIE